MKKVLGVIVAIVILVIMTMIHAVYGIMIDSIRESMVDISKFQFVAMGVSKMIPLLLAIWFIKLSWKNITSGKDLENEVK